MARFYLYQAVKVVWVHQPENQKLVGVETFIEIIYPGAWEFDDGDAYKLAGVTEGKFVASQLEPITYTPDGEEEQEEEEPIVEYAYLPGHEEYENG